MKVWSSVFGCDIEFADPLETPLPSPERDLSLPVGVHNTTVEHNVLLKNMPCGCDISEFYCYPEDGCCKCGQGKHHVHCRFCGGISQYG